MIRTFGGATGLTNQPQGLDVGLGGGSNIKSIQTGIYTLTSASANIPISAVDMQKSVVTVNLFPDSTTIDESGYSVKGKLTSNTSLNLSVNTYQVGMEIAWTVIEFANIKSLQKGEQAITSIQTDTPVAPVDSSKCIIFYSDTMSSVSAAGHASLIRIYLSSPTNLNFRQQVANARNVQWYIVEFP